MDNGKKRVDGSYRPSVARTRLQLARMKIDLIDPTDLSRIDTDALDVIIQLSANIRSRQRKRKQEKT